MYAVVVAPSHGSPEALLGMEIEIVILNSHHYSARLDGSLDNM